MEVDSLSIADYRLWIAGRAIKLGIGMTSARDERQVERRHPSLSVTKRRED